MSGAELLRRLQRCERASECPISVRDRARKTERFRRQGMQVDGVEVAGRFRIVAAELRGKLPACFTMQHGRRGNGGGKRSTTAACDTALQIHTVRVPHRFTAAI